MKQQGFKQRSFSWVLALCIGSFSNAATAHQDTDDQDYDDQIAAEAAPAAKILTPKEVLAAAPKDDWLPIPTNDLLVMTLPAEAGGKPRKITIQLLPKGFAKGHVRNVRKMAKLGWWDGTKLYRVIDKALAQWGGNYDQKKLPKSLETLPESSFVNAKMGQKRDVDMAALNAAISYSNTYKNTKIEPIKKNIWDAEKVNAGYGDGWPVGSGILKDRGAQSWPIFCRRTVSAAHHDSPDAGSGAELSTITGKGARNLDHEFGVVGRVIDGLDHLLALPKGDPPYGFYEDPKDRIRVISIKLASELPADQQVQYEYLASYSLSFARYIQAHRKYDDICGYEVPIRRRIAP